MMRPTDFGLPAKFTDFRAGQYESIIDIACSDRRFYLDDAPTGSGKSPKYITVSRMLEARTLVLTANKALQLQLMNDFAAIGMEDIRGQSNYRCKALDHNGELFGYGRVGVGCDEGPCHAGASCRLRRKGCLYFDQVVVASNAPLVVSNYAYWLTIGRWSNEEKIGNFDLLVCDEAHKVPDILAEHCAIRLDRNEIRILLGLILPSAREDPALWLEWAEHALSLCASHIDSTKAVFKDPYSDIPARKSASRHMRRIATLHRALSDLNNASIWRRSEPSSPDVFLPGVQTDWVIEPYEDGVQFLPVWAHAYAEPYLFRKIPKVILTSATLQPITAKYLGIADNEHRYRSSDSTFDPESRPIIYIPTAKIDRHSSKYQIKTWINRIDEIVAARQDRKGIVMARSYDYADTIMSLSAQSHCMISHSRRGLRDAISVFRHSRPPAVFVSPSVDEGFDFPDDDCRFIIIAKCPFADMRGSIVQARHKSDKKYLNYLTARIIIQQAGRGWRSTDDWCEVFIIDDNIRWFYPAARKLHMWPGYVMKSYRIANTVPNPPSLTTGRRPVVVGRRASRIYTRSPSHKA